MHIHASEDRTNDEEGFWLRGLTHTRMIAGQANQGFIFEIQLFSHLTYNKE